MRTSERFPARLAAALLAVVVAAPAAWGDPPPQAPAHGWRAKHDPYYVGYTGHQWQHDYGIREGRCDRREVGTVVGAVIGGAVGSAAGKGDSKLISILVGATIGAIVGHELGRNIDASDRACIGHALELGRDGSWVRWGGARPDVSFALQPLAGFKRDGRSCRRFVLETTRDGHRTREPGQACRDGDGDWRLLKG